MSYVSLQGFVPSPRFDNAPWTKAFVQESLLSTGPWTTIESITLSPADSDPENPISRNFSFEGTIELGWYRILWQNTAGTEQEFSLPIQNISNYVPQVSQVGALLRARTKDDAGNELGTFNDDTRPTYDGVLELIAVAVGDLSLRIGRVIPDTLIDNAARLAAIRAAMLVESSYFPELVAANRSQYAMYEKMWEEGYGDGTGKKAGTLVQAITSAQQSNNIVIASNPGLAVFAFPAPDNIGQRRF